MIHKGLSDARVLLKREISYAEKMKKKYTLWDKLSLKCVIVGDTGVGKSSLGQRLSTKTFKKEYSPTLFDNFSATVCADGIPYHLSLFDTAGKEDFNKVRVLSYINCDVFLVCFSIADMTSLENVVEFWVPELKYYLPKAPFVLVGTQLDSRFKTPDIQVTESTNVSTKLGMEVADKIGASGYVEISSLTGEGIDDLNKEIVQAAKKDWEAKKANKSCCASCEIV